MNLSSAFNQQFVVRDADGVAVLAAQYLLHTFVSGTTTPLPTYQDPDGTAPNTNPIELDIDGRCDLFLQPGQQYTLVLRDPDGALVRSWDNVVAAASTTGVVTSVNEQTGDVVLDADAIPYTPSGSFDWLTADNVTDAIEAVAERANKPLAENVIVADTGDFFQGSDPKNLEAVLAQIGAGLIPDQTGMAGRVLGTNGTNVLWTSGQTMWGLSRPAGLGGTREVFLVPGTYQITLASFFGLNMEGVSYVFHQTGSVGDVEVETSVSMAKASGFGHLFTTGAGLAVGVLEVAVAANYTMEIEAMPGVVTGQGSRLTLEKVA